MLKIVESNNQATVIHAGAVPPITVQAVNKRNALDALDVVRWCCNTGQQSQLIHGEVVTSDQALETLRQFVLTR